MQLIRAITLFAILAMASQSFSIQLISPSGAITQTAATLEAARTAANVKRIKVTSNHTITSSITWSASDPVLEIEKGGIITIPDGMTLDFNGVQPEIGDFQVFNCVGTGKVIGLKEARPEWFGADITGATDSTTNVQKAGDSSHKLYLRENNTYKVTEFVIKDSNYELTGKGVLNGTLVISGQSMAERIENIDINSVYIDAGDLGGAKNGIEFRYVRGVNIHGCRIYNTNKAITMLAEPAGGISMLGQSERIKIYDNRIRGCNYGLYSNHTIDGPYFQFADVHLTNNHIEYCLISNVNLTGVDGFVAASNTLYFPSYNASAELRAAKGNNIYVSHGGQVVLTGNNLFEAGLEAIHLDNVQYFVIGDNNIPWPGQRVASSGIKISGGNTVGSKYVFGTISGNNISFPTANAITIEDVASYINIVGNYCAIPGYSLYYYGDLNGYVDSAAYLASFTHYGVSATSGNEYINVGENVFSAKNNVLSGNSLDSGNLYTSTNGSYKTFSYIIKSALATETTLDVTGCIALNLAQTSASTITTLTRSDTKTNPVLIINAFNGNTTIQHNSTILLRDGINFNLKTGDSLTLVYTSGAWRETARNSVSDRYLKTISNSAQGTSPLTLDGLFYQDYHYMNSVDSTYTPAFTTLPTSTDLARKATVTFGGGAGVITLNWTNLAGWYGPTGKTTVAANKKSVFEIKVTSSGAYARCLVDNDNSIPVAQATVPGSVMPDGTTLSVAVDGTLTVNDRDYVSSTSQGTANLAIDGTLGIDFSFSNATDATYTPTFPTPPSTSKVRKVQATFGGGAGVITMDWTNVTRWIGAAGTTTVNTTKRSTYEFTVKSTEIIGRVLAENY